MKSSERVEGKTMGVRLPKLMLVGPGAHSGGPRPIILGGDSQFTRFLSLDFDGLWLH